MKIKGDASSRKVWIDVDGDGWKYLSPTLSQQLANHSPNGFNWGYGGSGPAQLALALCLAAGLNGANFVNKKRCRPKPRR